jgi:prephenate dehydratase
MQIKNEYLQGFDNQRIKITQIHSTPCKSTRTIKYRFPTSLHSNCISGNYILKVLDETKT